MCVLKSSNKEQSERERGQKEKQWELEKIKNIYINNNFLKFIEMVMLKKAWAEIWNSVLIFFFSVFIDKKNEENKKQKKEQKKNERKWKIAYEINIGKITFISFMLTNNLTLRVIIVFLLL